VLEKVDLTKKLVKTEYEKQICKLQVRLRELEFQLFNARVPALCLFEGWDAAGKGGAIKRVTQMLDPRGYSVFSYAAPQGKEKTHHYLWRFWRDLPRTGHLTIFDRSYYGRVLVERVEGFSAVEQWRRAYREINEFESHQSSFGMVLCKFWLQISKEEQWRRFKGRKLDPYRSYKLTEEDWRNRAKWDQYFAAAEEMLELTSTPHAPWTVVEANDKYYARVKVLRTLVAAIENQVN
jgi:AMP-polyphosphate phosphotransferase